MKLDSMLRQINTKKSKIKDHENKIKGLEANIEKLRENCPHKDIVGKAEYSDDFWNKGNTYYWVSAQCKICGKYWHIYAHNDEETYNWLCERIRPPHS